MSLHCFFVYISLDAFVNMRPNELITREEKLHIQCINLWMFSVRDLIQPGEINKRLSFDCLDFYILSLYLNLLKMLFKCNSLGHYCTRKNSLHAFAKPGMTPGRSKEITVWSPADRVNILMAYWEWMNIVYPCTRDATCCPQERRRKRGYVSIMRVLISAWSLPDADTF